MITDRVREYLERLAELLGGRTPNEAQPVPVRVPVEQQPVRRG